MYSVLTSSFTIFKYINNQQKEKEFFDTAAQRKYIQKKEEEGKSLWEQKKLFQKDYKKEILGFMLWNMLQFCEAQKTMITWD